MSTGIAILGAGTGGLAMASDLSLAGLRAIEAQGGIERRGGPGIRYVHEDVPFAFVPLAAMAEQLGVPMPVTRGLIDMCGTAFSRDYWTEGPSASELGIAGMDAAGIARLVEQG